MGFSLSGAFDSVRGAITEGIEKGLVGGADKTEEFFDLENPDGVHGQLAKKNIDNSLKAAKEEEGLTIDGESKTPITENILNFDNDSTLYSVDVEAHTYEFDDGNGTKKIKSGIDRPYALFNKYSLLNIEDGPVSDTGSKEFYQKIDPNTLANPTVSRIISLTSGDDNYGYRYAYADFALARYFNRIPNNMMLTLRRFSFPCPDDIISPQGPNNSGPQPDIARAVTWMGEATGNGLSDILNFSHGLNWKDVESSMQTLNSQQSGRSGVVGNFLNSSSIFQASVSAGQGKDSYDIAVKNANAGFDVFSETYPNHVYGPLNVIKNVLVRDQGLTFTQEFTLKFEYELRDIGGANPKVLMMDQLSNILALTYNNAPFWGGDVRYVGDGSFAKPLGDLEKLRSGDVSGFFKSVVNDFTGKKGGSAIGNITSAIKDFVSEGGVGKTLNNIIGGNLMKLFNSPQGGQVANSFLTGDPTGQWHLTIGNPLNPIAVIGNLACTDTKISFEGALGVQDFPERMVVEISLKPGRPRDKAEIESMFNSGRGRFYLQPADTADINETYNVSAYGNKDRKEAGLRIKKIANG